MILTVIAIYLTVVQFLGLAFSVAETESVILKVIFARSSFDAERSVATWFSAILLLVCGVALSVIAGAKWRRQEPYKLHWVILTLTFFGLSLDEVAGFHELFNGFLADFTESVSYLQFPWVIAGSIFVAGFGFLFFRFWLALKSETRWLFLLAALIFLTGALGLEIIGSQENYRQGASLAYSLITTFEELFEMLGAIIFLYALTKYISIHMPSIGFEVSS